MAGGAADSQYPLSRIEDDPYLVVFRDIDPLAGLSGSGAIAEWDDLRDADPEFNEALNENPGKHFAPCAMRRSRSEPVSRSYLGLRFKLTNPHRQRRLSASPLLGVT